MALLHVSTLCRFPAEPTPEFKFTKNLPKKADSLTKKELTITCTVNDHRAPVRWFKGEEEITSEKFGDKYIIEKNLIGHCKLTIVDAQFADSANYKCIIDNTKCVTRCVVNFEGNLMLPAWPECELLDPIPNTLYYLFSTESIFLKSTVLGAKST